MQIICLQHIALGRGLITKPLCKLFEKYYYLKPKIIEETLEF